MVEAPFFRLTDLRTRSQELKTFSISVFRRVENTPIRDLERDIAEFRFRRPVFIQFPLTGVGLEIRPFWRDRKPTPPLPISPVRYYPTNY